MRSMLSILTLCITTSTALAAQSVTGRWADGGCKDGKADLTVGAMRISGGFACTFKSVKRSGNTVRWQGICYSPDGDARGPGEMVARLQGGKLTLDGLGLGAGPLSRCR